MSLCTMYAFEGVADPNLLHCTHKYFGDESTVSRGQVIKELEAYFSAKPFKRFHGHFTEIEHLGDGSYRTAVAPDNQPFHLDLKAKLDALQPDQWPAYRPHVTVGRNTDELKLPIRDYVLMDDHKPVWSAKAHCEKIRASMMVGLKAAPFTMEEFEKALDATGTQGGSAGGAAGAGPHKLTPAELQQNPADLIDPPEPEQQAAQQELDDTWQAADSEGRGSHSWGINDNDSKNGPA